MPCLGSKMKTCAYLEKMRSIIYPNRTGTEQSRPKDFCHHRERSPGQPLTRTSLTSFFLKSERCIATRAWFTAPRNLTYHRTDHTPKALSSLYRGKKITTTLYNALNCFREIAKHELDSANKISSKYLNEGISGCLPSILQVTEPTKTSFQALLLGF